ncbi:hypothetical protein [Hahella sp. HN01]|uniref:hypothetical protein n=1 Tax=Hahella sp. HN01 TaxID=2847262 RepID=UPI001C1ED4B3|nr:hypothetical protein [Hahella sp. HN01]MBU6954887.1 hypothetical protein [Hahella sp. HN01]
MKIEEIVKDFEEYRCDKTSAALDIAELIILEKRPEKISTLPVEIKEEINTLIRVYESEGAVKIVTSSGLEHDFTELAKGLCHVIKRYSKS